MMYVKESFNILPREKLARSGASSLSDRELLALLIGSGNRQQPVGAIAEALQGLLDRSNAAVSAEDLTQIPGIGTAKAAVIAAALEYTRRRLCPAPNRVAFPRDVLPLVRHLADRPQETFTTLTMNGAHEVIRLRIISVGLVNRTVVHPREVFVGAIKDRAAALIACHNHPSGNLDPSREDREVTHRLYQAGETIGIPLLDHIIFSSRGYTSFLEEGQLSAGPLS